jgi:hypothetical protein
MSVTVGVTLIVMAMVMLKDITSVVVRLLTGLIHRRNVMGQAPVTLSREFPRGDKALILAPRASALQHSLIDLVGIART